MMRNRLIESRLTPNTISITGLVLNVAAAVLITQRLFVLARDKVEPGALIVADNVLSHAETLAEYSAARQADASLVSTTVPLDRGLELSVVLR